MGASFVTSSDADGWETDGASPVIGTRVMPLYFFDIAGDSPEADLDGVELADLAKARSQAVRFTGEMLQHNGHAIWDGPDLRVEVSDSNRSLLFVVTVSGTIIFPGT